MQSQASTTRQKYIGSELGSVRTPQTSKCAKVLVIGTVEDSAVIE